MQEALEFATAAQVWELLAAEVAAGRRGRRSAADALGRVLAADATTAVDFPPFDRAVMDGFALRAADLAGELAALPSVGLSRAGLAYDGPLPPGACVQINTGALLPPGADAVVMVEHARVPAPARESDVPDGASSVELRGPAHAGQNIERQGAICRAGAVIVPQRTRIGAGELAALAAGGTESVEVFESPRVTLLTTGDELVDAASRAPRGSVDGRIGQIVDSNSLLMNAGALAGGAEVAQLGRCPDEPGALSAQLELGLQCDVLVVAGGMSKGSHDLVPAALEQLGVRWLVRSLNLKPGKPTRIGRGTRGTWVIGLPGNPVSCGVCFHLFVRPILDGLQGLRVGAPQSLSAVLGAPLKAAGARPMYHPACWTISDEGRACVTPLAWRGSGDPFGLAGANALLARAAADPARPVGDLVRLIPLSAAR